MYTLFFFLSYGAIVFSIFHQVMCDKLPQYTAKHSTPKLANIYRSAINFFYRSPSEYSLWSINLIMIQYQSYTGLINYPVFQGCHLLLERKKCFLLLQIPLEYTKRLVISIFKEEWWARAVTVVHLTVLVHLSWRCQAPSLAYATPLNVYICAVHICWPASNECLVRSPILLPCFWCTSFKTEDSFSCFGKMRWCWKPVRTASNNNFS